MTEYIKYAVCAEGRSRGCVSLEDAIAHAETLAADGWPTVIKNLVMNGKIVWRSNDDQTRAIRLHRSYGR